MASVFFDDSRALQPSGSRIRVDASIVTVSLLWKGQRSPGAYIIAVPVFFFYLEQVRKRDQACNFSTSTKNSGKVRLFFLRHASSVRRIIVATSNVISNCVSRIRRKCAESILA